MAIVVAAKIDSTEAKRGADDFVRATQRMKQGASEASASMANLIPAVAIAAAVAAVGTAAVSAAKHFVKMSDDLASLKARLDNVANGGVGAQAQLDALAEAAGRARAPLTDLAGIYRRNANALSDMGRSQTENVRLSETLSKVTKLSGVSAQEAGAAMQQLSQAIVSGKLQGDEFRSVAENLPEVLRILQKETGKTGKELRKLAEDGKITGELLVNALLNASSGVDAAFAKMPATAESSFAVLKDQTNQYIGKAGEAAGVSKAWAGAFDAVKDAMAGPGAQAAFAYGAQAVAAIGDGVKPVIQFMSDARIKVQAFTEALKETQVYKAFTTALEGISNAAKSAASGALSAWQWLKGEWRKENAEVAAGLDDFASKIGEAEKKIRDFESWSKGTTVTVASQVKMPTWDAKKLKVSFGSDDEANKKLREALALHALIAEKIQAEIDGDTVKANALENEISSLKIINDEMKKGDASLIARLQLAARREEQLKREKALMEETRRVGEDYTRTIFDGLMNGAKAGKSFAESLKDVALQIAEMTIKLAILEPLTKSLGKSFANAFPSFNPTTLNDSGGWLTSVTSALGGSGLPFAKGDVFNSPLSFTSGGMQGQMAEAGPEAVMPLSRGPDGSLGVRMNGGNAAQAPANVTINIAGDATEETVEKLRRVARQEIASAAPSIVSKSVQSVAKEHRSNRNYLAR